MSLYIALVHKDPDSGYGVSFPDFPGCISVGRTLEEARVNAGEALALYLEGETDLVMPVPSSLDEVLADPENGDAIAILAIPAPMTASKTVRVNITISEAVLSQIDRYAEKQGYTRSGFLVAAAKKALEDAA